MLKVFSFATAIILTAPSWAVAQDNPDQITEIPSVGTQIPPLSGEVSIEQIGTDNIAEVTGESNSSVLIIAQRGEEQSAFVRLSGVNNQGDVIQEGSDNSADVLITGTINTFSVSQSASEAGTLNGNQVLLEQIGFGNTAFQTQVGSDNTMTLRQNGDNNFADLLQDGQSNLMELDQFGNDNSAALKQFQTRANPIIVRQSGGMSVEITQSGN